MIIPGKKKGSIAPYKGVLNTAQITSSNRTERWCNFAQSLHGLLAMLAFHQSSGRTDPAWDVCFTIVVAQTAKKLWVIEFGPSKPVSTAPVVGHAMAL